MKFTNIILFCFLVGESICLPFENIENGLVAYYEFELNGEDSSSSGFHGTFHGNPNFIERSNEWAMSFDGIDDYFRVNQNFAPITEFTWSFWLHLTEASFQQDNGLLMAIQAPPYHWAPLIMIDSNKDSLVFGSTGATEITKSNFPVDDWFMLTVMRYANGETAMFVNDELKNTGTTAINQTLDYLIIGGQQPINKFTNFSVDDVRIYNRALSNSEVEQLYMSETNAQPLQIINQPTSRTIAEGADVEFSTIAEGTEPISYQWQFNGDDIQGANESVLRLENVNPGSEGIYRVLVFNSLESILSAPATLTVNSIDSDQDGLSDFLESQLGTNPNLIDTDDDGLTDKQEVDLGINPLSKDSDNDGFLDKVEIDNGSDPGSSASAPEILKLTTYVRLEFGTQQGSVYILQISTDGIEWADSGNSFVGPGGKTDLFVRADNLLNTFYRLKKLSE